MTGRSGRFPGALLCAGAVGAVVGAGPASGATHPPTTAGLAPSSVVIDLRTDGTHAPAATVTLIANLAPEAAYGTVTLYDGNVEVSSGDHYRSCWSFTTDELAIGPHHFTVDFSPTAASGYAPSHATVDYVVIGPSSARPAVSPTPSPVATKTKNPQPIVVSIPTVKASSTVRPTKSATARPSPTPSPSESVKGIGSRRHGSTMSDGPLPFTGLDAIQQLTAAAASLALGLVLVLASRRRRARRT